jgi:phosphoglycerate dehydrogenase-like enzyme
MRIALADIARTQADRLRLRLPDDELVEFPEGATGMGEVDVLVASRFGAADPGRIAFRLLQVPGAGLDKIALAAVPPASWVCNAYEHEGPIAEYVLSAMLDATVGLGVLAREIPEKGWAAAYFSRRPHGELAGRTVGLIGLGHIGDAVARRAKAFDMRVTAVVARLRQQQAEHVDRVATAEGLAELLAEADFVVVACPLNEATRGMIGADELNRMKRSAILINVARAEIVVEQDLFAALADGAIAGAVLDPWYHYPASASDPIEPSRFRFDRLPNVRMTPHASGWTDGVWERRADFFADNITRLRDGRPLRNVVRAPLTETAAPGPRE